MARLLFCLLCSIVAAFIIMVLSRFVIPENSGLAAGATVLAYGLLGFVVALIAAFIGSRYLKHNRIKLWNSILALIVVSIAVFAYVRILQGKKDNDHNKPVTPTKEEGFGSLIPVPGLNKNTFEEEIGLGMASPRFDIQTFYFFANPEAQVDDISNIIDSLTFSPSGNSIEIATAPPWLNPERIKLDYGIFNFRVLSITDHYIEVMANKTTNKTAWVDRHSFRYLDWPSFLLEMYSVEPLSWEDNPVRIKGLSSASTIPGIDDQYILQPVQIKEEWLRVKIFSSGHKHAGFGWIQWRSKDGLQISYSPLS